jgi:hypothetical protein
MIDDKRLAELRQMFLRAEATGDSPRLTAYDCIDVMAIYDELLRLRSAPAQGKDASSNSLARLNCQHCHASLGRWTKYEDHELACEFCGRISEFNAAPPPGKDNRAEREKEALLGGALCLEATALSHRNPQMSKGATKADTKDARRAGQIASADKLEHAATLRSLAEKL